MRSPSPDGVRITQVILSIFQTRALVCLLSPSYISGHIYGASQELQNIKAGGNGA